MKLLSTDIHHMWLPEGKPVGVLICVHGIGLHGGCYDSLGKTLANLGYAVLAIDVRGQGCWRKWGDHRLSIRTCIADLQAALAEIRMLYPGLPVILAGESMGGAIALKTASLDESLVDGLILSSPAVDASKHYFNHWELWLKYYLMRNSKVSLVKAVIERATCDQSMIDEWLNDHLAAREVYVSDLVAVRNLIRDCEYSAPSIVETPVLVLQGYKDKLFCPRDTIRLFDRLTAREKELVYIGDAHHLMLQSRKTDHRCLGVVSSWMENLVARLAQRDPALFSAPYCALQLVPNSASTQDKAKQPQRAA